MINDVNITLNYVLYKTNYYKEFTYTLSNEVIKAVSFFDPIQDVIESIVNSIVYSSNGYFSLYSVKITGLDPDQTKLYTDRMTELIKEYNNQFNTIMETCPNCESGNCTCNGDTAFNRVVFAPVQFVDKTVFEPVKMETPIEPVPVATKQRELSQLEQKFIQVGKIIRDEDYSIEYNFDYKTATVKNEDDDLIASFYWADTIETALDAIIKEYGN
jgi:hypothetical protein